MKPYSIDLRERVIAAHTQGMTRSTIMQLFQISQGSITRWVHRHQTTGDLTPHHAPGRTLMISPDQEPQLRHQLEAAPDATLAAHTAHWNADHGTSLSTWTMARAIRRLGWSRKKRR
jgi:transposase